MRILPRLFGVLFFIGSTACSTMGNSPEKLPIIAFRGDNFPFESGYTHPIYKKWAKKSYLDSEGNLHPANPRGRATPVDHIGRASDVSVKNDSPFTSFSEKQTENFGAKHTILLKLRALATAIRQRNIQNIDILTQAELKAGTQALINELADQFRANCPQLLKEVNAYMRLFDTQKETYLRWVEANYDQRKLDALFWNPIEEEFDASKLSTCIKPDEKQRMFDYFNTYRHTTGTQEILIRGVIPAEFIELKSSPAR